MADEQFPGLGHNRPDYAADLTRTLPVDFADLIKAIDEHERAAEALPATVESDSDDARISQFVSNMRNTFKQAEANRVDEKAPFLAAERAVDGFFEPAKLRLKNLAEKLTARVTAYKVRKEDEERRRRQAEEQAAREREREARRREQEEAAAAEAARRKDHRELHDKKADQAAFDAQRANEDANAAAAQALAKPAELTRVRSDEGAVSSLKKEWTGIVEDYEAIPLDRLRPYISTAEIDKALRAFVKAGGRQLPGARIFEKPKTAIR